MSRKNTIFLIGTVLSYVALYLVPSLRFLPIPFGLFFLSSLYYVKDIKKALFLSAVFSIPYPWGKSFLHTEEKYLFSIIPFRGFVVLLSFISLKEQKVKNFSLPNLFIILFFLWQIVSFVFSNTEIGVLSEVSELGIVLLFYFVSQIYTSDKQIKKMVVFIFYTFIIFESSIALAQFVLGRPLGLFIEEGVRIHPFGRVADEDAALFRPFGTFTEPTHLARFLTILLPMFLLNVKYLLFSLLKKIRRVVLLMAMIGIFVSLTRFSWFFTWLLFIFVFIYKQRVYKRKINIFSLFKKKASPFLPAFLVIIILGFSFYPYFKQRLKTTPVSFAEGGSFDFRVKLMYEAVTLIKQYPLFGVGSDRFIPFALKNNVTGIFDRRPSSVHNVPLLIASEMGVPALIFFIGFILYTYSFYFKKRQLVSEKRNREFLDAAALGAVVYLLESMVGTIFLSQHFLLFILYMGLLTS